MTRPPPPISAADQALLASFSHVVGDGLRASLVDALLQARQAGRGVPEAAKWAAAVPDAEAAYAVQQATGERLGAWGPGELPRWWKSGGPARTGVLSHAPLPPAGVRHAGDDAAVALDDLRFLRPGVEAEIAFRLGQAVTPDMAAGLDEAGALALVDAWALAIEVVDTRWAEGLADSVPPLMKTADLQVHGALALGPWRTDLRVRDRGPEDWAVQRIALSVDGEPAVATVGGHPLGTPGWVLVPWLRHLTRHGAVVPAGSAVTTGTWTGLTPVLRGARVVVEYDGIGALTLQL